MNKNYQPYQQPINSTIGFLNLKKTFLLLIIIVHYSLFTSIYAQNIDPNGYNEIFYSNGNMSSEGNLENGKPNGYWNTYFESGGLKTEGNRVDFKLDSTWKFYSESNYLRQTINYRDGLKNGMTIYYDSLNIIQKKEIFKSNLLNGMVTTFYNFGQLKSSTPYLYDKKEGFAYEYDSLGLIITIDEYTNGFLRNHEEINRYDSQGNKNGEWKEFYESGKIKWEGKFAHGDLNGVVKEYTPSGGLKTMEKYEQGELNEESEEVVFFELEKKVRPDGSMLIGGYNNDMKQGVFREYDSTGTLLISFEYKDDVRMAEGSLDTNGSKHGLWKYYYISGELMSQGEFEHGYRNNEWIYFYKNKDIQQKGKYINGVPNG
ncbi:MAG: antitoxin component YwqK of YwqJK toxin-antitoxin module, partial [Psychroserpens sp.]